MRASIAIIGAPTSAGAYGPGQEEGPRALRGAGLAEGLRSAGYHVSDLGDIPSFRWQPDRLRPRAMNVAAVAAGIAAVADEVSQAVADGHLPLVLGGDCTVELGTVIGMRRHQPSVRLVYLDAHPDLNTPTSVPDGALDWMGVAHLLGIPDTLDEITGLGAGSPLLDASDLVLLGNAPTRSTEHELRVIRERSIANVDENRVRADPAAAGAEALELVGRGHPYLVHLDTDTIDFAELPLAENTTRNVGLAFESVMQALDGVLAGDGLAALTITELNPFHGAPDGSTVRRFATRLAESFAARAFA
jgi:arginase